MNVTSAEFPPGVSEFEKAGFTEGAGEVVKPKLVLESPVNLECRVSNIIELSTEPLGGSFVIGKVLRIHFKEGVYDEESGEIRADYYNLISRMGGTAYGTTKIECRWENRQIKFYLQAHI